MRHKIQCLFQGHKFIKIGKIAVGHTLERRISCKVCKKMLTSTICHPKYASNHYFPEEIKYYEVKIVRRKISDRRRIIKSMKASGIMI